MNRTVIVYLACAIGGAVILLSAQALWAFSAPCHLSYDLLSPLRRCTAIPVQGEWNYQPLRDDLQAKKDQLKASGAVTHMSIYFQDLDHGPRFGIGEYDKFFPASLIKLPILIFFLHAADNDPAILDKQLSFQGELAITDNATGSGETIEPNTPYAIREMLRKMIVFSDNRSALVLLHEMNSESERSAYDTFHDLDVLPMMLADQNYVEISSYAKLFAILYNSAYLSKEMSQFALQLLSEATFKQGIAAGVPPGLTVAHKFGFTDAGSELQLHDCGIVYHPNMSYVLCVMTSGLDQNSQNEAIIDVSKTVYEAVNGERF